MTANHPEDLVARLTARASSANGNGRPAGGYWPDDAELDRQAAATLTSLVGERDALERKYNHECNAHDLTKAAVESTIRNRDETIAAQAAALRDIIDYVHVESGTQLSPDGTVDNLRLRLGNDKHSIRIWDGRNSWITAHLNILGSYIERARALTSPHQEGTGT